MFSSLETGNCLEDLEKIFFNLLVLDFVVVSLLKEAWRELIEDDWDKVSFWAEDWAICKSLVLSIIEDVENGINENARFKNECLLFVLLFNDSSLLFKFEYIKLFWISLLVFSSVSSIILL